MKRIFGIISNPRALSVLTLFLLLPLAIDPANAKPPNCEDPDPRPACQNDGGDDNEYAQTNSPNWVILGDGPGIGIPWEGGDPRFCAGDGEVMSNPNPQGGIAYVCHQDVDFYYGGNWVHVDLSDLLPEPDTPGGDDYELIKSGRDDYLCDRLLYPNSNPDPEGEDLVPVDMGNTQPWPGRDDSYGTRLWMYYLSMDPTWNDGPCTVENETNSCYVKIHISAYFNDDCNTKKCGRLIAMDAWGRVEPNAERTDEGKIEINPFSRYQEIDIEEMTVNFKGIGRDKVVASCYYDNMDGSGYTRPIKFYTFPDSPPEG
jgi:hypothetical protein